MEFKNKKIIVFGLGKSGLAAIKKLYSCGARVSFSESEARSNVDKKTLAFLKKTKVFGEFGKHSLGLIAGADLIVVSPGIHLDLPVFKKARKNKVPIISEIELGSYFVKKPIIAVTGTNGKTTTTALIAHILNKSGFTACAVGNIGTPLIAVNDAGLDFIVLEVSSYQLASIIKFKPFISIILNITPDHIAWHKTMKNYALAKANIFKNQDQHDYFIYNQDDDNVMRLVKRATAVKIPFSLNKTNNKGIFLDKNFDLVLYLNNEKTKIINRKDSNLMGQHNTENLMAAAASAFLCGANPADIKKAVKSFNGAEHRIEFVRQLGGVSFYNDSKATNPDSSLVAVRALGKNKNIVLIVGGRPKQVSLMPLIKEIKKSVKKVVLIGEAIASFKKAFDRAGFYDYVIADSLQKAVKKAHALSLPKEIVLLSPACASFDAFKNFEHRGQVFKQLVWKI